MTTRVHFKREKFDVYIGRPSKWGNPYKIGVDGTREEVILKYEAWIRGSEILMRAVKRELKGKVLGCWCDARTPCHGDVLIKIADEEEELDREG